MRDVFTRETITAGRAKFFIYAAAGFAAFRGLFTLLFVLRGTPGVTPWNVLDVAILLGVAVGLVRRNIAAAWAGVIYCGLDAALKMVRQPPSDPLRHVGELIAYGMAVVCIGLYPRLRSTRTSGVSERDHEADAQGGRAV